MEENKMLSSTRSIVKRILYRGSVPALMVIALTLFPVLASADEDPCSEKGIYIRNSTLRPIWYTRNGGPCTLWHRGHILILKPEDTLIIYRDMTCERDYCPKNPTYDAYKFFDANQNCRVKILPRCKLSDM